MGGGAAVAVAGADEVNTSSWPDLVGHQLTEVVGVIKSQRPDVHIKLFAAADPEPRDFDPHRVCLFVDNNFAVVRMPVVG